METNNFYNNGSFNDKARRLSKNGVYLAEMAYENKNGLDNLSKPLNNIDTEKPLRSKDGYIMLYC